MSTFYLNPFYLFGFAFLSVMGMYFLGLSDLYTNGDYIVHVVFVIMCISSLAIGFIFKAKFNKYFKRELSVEASNIINWPSAVFVVLGFLLESYASGGIPILLVMGGGEFDYQSFGIKTFHVFYMGYMSAFSIVNFERFLHSRKKMFLIKSLLGVAITMMIINRGAMMLIVIPLVLLYLADRKERRVKSGISMKLTMLFSVLAFIFLFGYLGDKRMEAGGYKESKPPIYRIGHADPIFTDYGLPSGFFWVYLYASSPYATLAAQEKYDNVDKGDISKFLYFGIVPDFISKYLDFDLNRSGNVKRLTVELTVSTGFGRILAAYGYFGVMLLFIYFCFVCLFFVIVNRRLYIRSACAMLGAVAVLMTFDNMLIFSSCLVQLILISTLPRFKFKRLRLI